MWFRKTRKEMAQEFVDDVKEEVKKKTKQSTTNWLNLALLCAPVAIEIVDLVIGTEKVSVPGSVPSNFTLYIDTINFNL